MAVGGRRSKPRRIHHIAIGIKTHGKRNRRNPAIVIADSPSHVIGRDIGNGNDFALGGRNDELVGKLALDIHALHPRTLLKALNNCIAIDIEQRRVVGEIDELLCSLLRYVFRTVNHDIRGGEKTRLEQNGPDDKENHNHSGGSACNKAS